MESALPSISPTDLYSRLGTATAPTLLDVRRPADFATAGELIISARHRDPDEVEQWRKDPAPRRPGDRKLRPWAASQPRRRRASAHSRLRCTLSAGGHRRLGGERPAHAPNDRHDARQVGHTRAPQDRSHRLPMADPALHRSAGRIHLRPDQGRSHGRQGDRGNSL